MADLIRTFNEGEFTHAPAWPNERTAAGGARLFSEQGPIRSSGGWSPPSAQEILAALAGARDGDGLKIGKSSVLRFGRSGTDFNEFLSMTISERDPGDGVRMAARSPSYGDIMIAAFPQGGNVPCMFRKEGRKSFVDLPWDVPKGDRCFVLDGSGKKLVTASMPSRGMDYMPLIPRVSLLGWVVGSCPAAIPEEHDGFSVRLGAPGEFVVVDANASHRYRGRLRNGGPEEVNDISNAIARHGLPGVLVSYQLSKEKGNG
jgi:hypothetical protein